MKSFALTATTVLSAAAVLSASAAACAGTPNNLSSGTTQPATRHLLAPTTTGSCRLYWFPVTCSTERAVTSAARTQHSTDTTSTHAQTCNPPSNSGVPRIYWIAAHCQ
jgi:hypothetical protein